MATHRNDDLKDNPDRNPDAITGAPGSHPIGTGVGAAGGGAAGAAIGAAVSGPAAPIGATVGAVVGAVAGGLAGKGAAEAVNPTAEDEYWRSNYANRPYYEKDYEYERDYRPAYEHGWNAAGQYQGRTYTEVEPDLERGWDQSRSQSRLGWDKARNPTRDAFERVRGDESRNVTAGSASAYPGQATDSARGSEADSGFATTGMDDRTGGLMGTQIGGSTYAEREYDDFAKSCRARYHGRNFDEVEGDLRREWSSRGSRDSWDNVRDKVRDSWQKV